MIVPWYDVRMDTATDRVAVRMDPDLKHRIKQAAEADHRTISAYVTLACMEKLNRDKESTT